MLRRARITYITFLFTFFFWVNQSFVFAGCPGTVNSSFTTSVIDVCGTGATPISFVNTSTGSIATTTDYEWYLNGTLFDNTTGLSAPINSSVSSVGTYTFMLVATDSTIPCQDTSIVIVTVHPTPIANFNFTPNNVCALTPIGFTNTSTGTESGTSYSWNFGDGGTATNTNPTYSYGAGGSFNVTLTMTNAPGCTSTATQTVTMLPIPNVNISGDDGDGNLTYCLFPGDTTSFETVIFSNTTTGGTSYVWDFGDGSPIVTTSSSSPIPHVYTTYGTYTVTMTAYHANGCPATATLTVVFEKFVSAALTLDITEYSGCSPHNLTTLQNLSVNANTYVWDFGDGTVITTTQPIPPSYSYTTGGSYTITLTASNSCNTATATISPIIIIGGPTANYSQSVTYGCAPQNISFTNYSTDTQPANNYTWNMGNGNTYTSTITPPVQTYDTTGTYTVTMVAGNACGTDTMTTLIYIDTVPQVILVVIPDEGCTPLTVQSNATATGGNLTWQWWIDGVYTYTSPNTIPNQIFTTPVGNTVTVHSIRVRVSNQCGWDDTTVYITVHPTVMAIFTGNDSICDGGSITFTQSSYGDSLTWNWDMGNGTTFTTVGPETATYNGPGTYNVQLIVTGYCGVDTAIMLITVLPIPVADISPPISFGCQSDAFTFVNNSTAGGIYLWNFGALGTPATSSLFTPPPVSFSDSGSQMVTLQVNVLGCTNADTAYVDVQPLPQPAFTLTPVSGCTPLQVVITNNTPVSVGDTYSWDFGNGNSSTNQNPSNQNYITFTNDSSYNVWLVVSTSNGCKDSLMQTVIVHPLPIADFTPLPDTICANNAVGFLNNSTGASIFYWDFGDGSTSTTISPSYIYTIPGTYTIQLVVSTVYGCADSITHDVVVDSIPVADFSFTTECTGTATTFTDLSSGGIISWAWNFGDGSPVDNFQSPIHLYATSGTYNVSLTVTNMANCPVTISQLVLVNDVPIAAFTNSSTCLGQSTAFTNLTTGSPINWNWDMGDGSPSYNTQNPSHPYSSVGTYNVTLIVGGGSGCYDTITQLIQVDSVPTAGFNFTSVCMNDQTLFTSTTTGGANTYYWDLGDGTTDATNNPSPSHIYTTAGTYNVLLIAGYSLSGCTDSILIPVEAYPRTVPSFTNNTPCLGSSTLFLDATTNLPISWTWNFGDGSSNSATQNPQNNYSSAGIYTVTLTTQNTYGCVDSIQQMIQVFSLPTSNFTFDTICDGVSTTFTDLSTSAVTWNWNMGDGSPIEFNPSPTHLFASAGTYNVQLIVFNSDGCSDTLIQSVIVNPNPVADFGVSTACLTYPSTFSDSSVSALTWQWNLGDGSPLNYSQNPVYTYASDGIYSTTLTVTNIFGCMDSISKTATVLPQPEAGFVNSVVCAGQSVSFTDTTTGSPNQWSWNMGDGSPIDNTQNPNHNYVLGGTYNITFIAGNTAGCYDTIQATIDVFTVPFPEFTADTVCLFNVTSFTDYSTNSVTITTWYWDLGDGNSSYSPNPTYIYQTPGTFTVSLTVANANGCDSTITHAVIVNDIPVAEFIFDTVCVGTPTTFTDISTGVPVSWVWDMGDGTTLTTGPIVQHIYASTGNYLVSLIVDGGIGCVDQIYHVVTVSDVVTAGMTFNDSVCAKDLVVFTDNSTITSGAITEFSWDFGDTSPIDTNQNTSHLYLIPGTYTIVHTATSSGGCVSSTSGTLTVNNLPTASFSATIPCEDQATLFTDLSTVPDGSGITSWSWDLGDGSGIDYNQNPTHIYPLNGTYNVTLNVSSGFGCLDSITTPVLIYPQPNAAFSNNTVCPGLPISFTDLSSVPSGTISSWNWYLGDGTTDNLQNPTHIYPTNSDTFNVQLTVTTDMGCVDSIMQQAITYPIVYFNYQPFTLAGCAPLMVQFADSSTTSGGGGIINWLWDMGDNTFTFSQFPTHIYPVAGDYYVGLTVTTIEGCTFSNQLTYPITVFPQPQAGFTANPGAVSINNPGIQFTDESVDAMNWLWDMGDNTTDNNINPFHEYTDTGYYTVMQIVYNNFGCSDSAFLTIKVNGEFAFYTPNAFTPNGDGYNDWFYGIGYGYSDYHFMVFDRWGDLIFESYDDQKGWDGKLGGNDVMEDVYVWKAILHDEYKQHIYYGHVTVIR